MAGSYFFMRAFRLILLLVWRYTSWDVLWLCKGPFGKSPGPEKHQTQTSKTAIIFAPYPQYSILQQRHPKTCQNWRMTIYLWPKYNSLPIWICVEIRGFPFPNATFWRPKTRVRSRWTLTRMTAIHLVISDAPPLRTFRNGRFFRTSFHNKKGKASSSAPAMFWSEGGGIPFYCDEEKYSKYHRIWPSFHFRSDS